MSSGLEQPFLGKKQQVLPMWYLAGPFFNPEQLSLISSIETTFIDNGVPMFSPRLCDENKKKVLSNQDAATIFARNVDNILTCGCMLAVLDWKLSPRQKVMVVQDSGLPSALEKDWGNPKVLEKGDIMAGTVIAPELNLPDTGTVFEMGAMFMKWLMSAPKVNSHPKLVGFTERGEKDKLNIMLTQACCGIVRGVGELNAFLNKGDIQWHLAKPWTGANL